MIGGNLMDDKTTINEYRNIILYNDVTEKSAKEAIERLKELEFENPLQPIDFYVSSYGGNIHDFLAIYDIIRTLKCPVNTIALGKATSAGAMLLMVGTGERIAYKNARIMIHELSAGNMGQLTDMNIYHKELQNVQEILSYIISEHTGQDIEKIKKDLERDLWMSAYEALDYGIVDKVI